MTEIEKSVAVLRLVSNFLRSLSSGQVDDLLEGRARIVLTQPKPSSDRSDTRQRPLAEFDELRRRLQAAKSREEARSQLDKLDLRRAELTILAQSMEMPVRKSDNIETMKDRIVDAAVGFRLGSEAIRGVSDEAQDNF